MRNWGKAHPRKTNKEALATIQEMRRARLKQGLGGGGGGEEEGPDVKAFPVINPSGPRVSIGKDGGF